MNIWKEKMLNLTNNQENANKNTKYFYLPQWQTFNHDNHEVVGSPIYALLLDV